MSDKPVQAAAAASSKKKKAIIISIIVIIALIIAWFLLRPKPEPVVTMENVRQIEAEIEDKVAKGMFETHMNTTWVFPSGSEPSSNAVMGNAPNNNYAFSFTVTLNDTDETVFTSGMIPVGAEIAEIKLNKVLSPGEYPATVRINMVEDDGTPVESNMGITVMLVINS
ncbi:MAG: hypothetical protein FWG94_12295 [Oscillospiraceae bacterium]|nr:hypothetical protein [Oscillospiraceae bacterium]